MQPNAVPNHRPHQVRTLEFGDIHVVANQVPVGDLQGRIVVHIVVSPEDSLVSRVRRIADAVMMRIVLPIAALWWLRTILNLVLVWHS